LLKALKGRDIPAQGNALGNGMENRRALKGRDMASWQQAYLPDDGPGFQPLFS
jgi:hypothetical protein